MKVLGIDPGTLVTGFGVIERGNGGRLTYLHHGRVRTKPAMTLPERLLAVYNGITEVIGEFKPDAVSVESIFFAKNARSAIMLGHARGVSLMCAASFGIRVFEYDPRTIKLAVTGYGGATKDQMQKMVKMLLHTPSAAESDAADALAAAICHIHHLRGGVQEGPGRGSSWRKIPFPAGGYGGR